MARFVAYFYDFPFMVFDSKADYYNYLLNQPIEDRQYYLLEEY